MMKKPNMNQFILESPFQPTGDQPDAIDKLTRYINRGIKESVLVGVTGSGKTFTMANVIAHVQKPTLVISHNKTLASQLYQEFREFFPNNAVSYFVSYYDYYLPESYIPQTDTYIEKETEINEEIDKLRLSSTTNILTRRDVIVIASVSCIYNIGSPREYGHFVLELHEGIKIRREDIIKRLVQLQYVRSVYDAKRSTFRVHGEIIDVFPAYEDTCIRIEISQDVITHITYHHPLTGLFIKNIHSTVIYPAKHYMTDPRSYKEIFSAIMNDMKKQELRFQKEKKYIEAQRIRDRVTHDLEMVREIGYVNGIENYSRYFDGRNEGEAPYTLFDYFSATGTGNDWLVFIDESHMTIPQIRGMYNGDRSRKQTLVDYGFRLPSALDNRPLRFDEFLRRLPTTVYVSATPGDWEYGRTTHIVEQFVRPTGLVDPKVTIKPTSGQIEDLEKEIRIRIGRNERVIVTTLTKQMAEDLSEYLKEKGLKVEYLHSEIITLERNTILGNLRKGNFDVIIGVNLLREGLDLPEVSLVAIMDADREGFLRSTVSLIQTMGRAARSVTGEVILYGDTMTTAMREAINEVNKRRAKQIAYNTKHNIIPKGIHKPIRITLMEEKSIHEKHVGLSKNIESMTPLDKKNEMRRLRTEMNRSAKQLDFENAARIRDYIAQLSQ